MHIWKHTNHAVSWQGPSALEPCHSPPSLKRAIPASRGSGPRILPRPSSSKAALFGCFRSCGSTAARAETRGSETPRGLSRDDIYVREQYGAPYMGICGGVLLRAHRTGHMAAGVATKANVTAKRDTIREQMEEGRKNHRQRRRQRSNEPVKRAREERNRCVRSGTLAMGILRVPKHSSQKETQTSGSDQR